VITASAIQTNGSSALTLTAGPELPVYPLEDEELDPRLEEDRDEEPEDLPLDPPEYPWPPPGRASTRAVAKPSRTMARIRRMRAAGIVMSSQGCCGRR